MLTGVATTPKKPATPISLGKGRRLAVLILALLLAAGSGFTAGFLLSIVRSAVTANNAGVLRGVAGAVVSIAVAFAAATALWRLLRV